MRINEIINEEQLDEINWKKGLATAAMAAGAIGSMGNASARVMPGDDPSINRLTGKPNIEQPAQAAEPSASMPNQNLQAVDQVERTASGATIVHDGKSYDVKVVPKGSLTPRGGKMMKVSQAQFGERGIGNYVVYLLNNGTAYLYK